MQLLASMAFRCLRNLLGNRRIHIVLVQICECSVNHPLALGRAAADLAAEEVRMQFCARTGFNWMWPIGIGALAAASDRTPLRNSATGRGDCLSRTRNKGVPSGRRSAGVNAG